MMFRFVCEVRSIAGYSVLYGAHSGTHARTYTETNFFQDSSKDTEDRRNNLPLCP